MIKRAPGQGAQICPQKEDREGKPQSQLLGGTVLMGLAWFISCVSKQHVFKQLIVWLKSSNR